MPAEKIKPMNIFDKKGTTSIGDDAASKVMAERVAGTNKPAPSAAGNAAIAERAATVDFAQQLQNASRSDAADMRKAADNARHAPPPPSPRPPPSTVNAATPAVGTGRSAK